MVGTPLQSSAAPTIAISNIVDESAYERFVDNYDDIEWSQLPRYCKTLRTQKHKKSWVFQYGYRVSLLHDTLQIYWVCKYCHTHKSPMNHILDVRIIQVDLDLGGKVVCRRTNSSIFPSGKL